MPIINSIGSFSFIKPSSPTFLGDSYIFDITPTVNTKYLFNASGPGGTITIDWGDGQGPKTYNTLPGKGIIISWATPGTKTVVVNTSTEFLIFNRSIPDLVNYSTQGSVRPIIPKINVKQWGTKKFFNMDYMFSGVNELIISASDIPDLSICVSMTATFEEILNFNYPIENWDISNIETLDSTFKLCNSFNQPLNNWNTSNVTSMTATFSGANSFNQPLNNWNTAKVTSMSGMFTSAKSFNQPLNNWNTANVTDIGSMFYAANSFNQPLNNWNTAKVTNIGYMFSYATSFNQPLNNWNTSNVTFMWNTFQSASSFNQPLNNWNTAKVTTMNYMFAGATKFDQNISGWQVANVGNRHVNFDTGTPSTWTSAEKPTWIA